MVCSSSIFIFAFLPAVLAGYYILIPWRKIQNVWLAAVSLFFYAWGEPYIVLLMAASIVMNYLFGLLVSGKRNRKTAKMWMAVMLFYNLAVLFVFKYLTFVLGVFGIDTSGIQISLPIGISFYTFQAISYVIDVYRGDGEAQKNPLNVALYIAFFPQLIAGPIVRYQTIAEEIQNRKETWEDFSYGVQRFITGLCKKVILANSFAPVADYMFGHSDGISSASAWLGAICYMFQIYFDFSGYSDMAIGMGRMFGFHFLENFQYPYISRSITEFWRRWHISLGTWFRDYVYIPLGGSRVKSRKRLVFNLFAVWLLTGIWHGANWTFLVWGIWYLVLLVFEKLTGVHKKKRGILGNIFSYAATMYCVIAGWVIFRADSLGMAVEYLKKMCFLGSTGVDAAAVFLLRDLKILLIAAVICCVPSGKVLREFLERRGMGTCAEVIKCIGQIGLFLVCIGYMVSSSYNPFIYFNF